MCFLLPKTFCKEIEAVLARFWWQKLTEKRGIHWCEWSYLCNLKEASGMGSRDLAKFNIALLAKQRWRLIMSPTSMVGRVLKVKYFPHSGFLSAQLGSKPLLIWRSIWSARRILELGLRWKVGLGVRFNIWNDFLLPGPSLEKIKSARVSSVERVSDLIMPNMIVWNEPLIDSIFSLKRRFLLEKFHYHLSPERIE
ncbi:hypothetical protein J1N35_025844 [Gossypium stocksii]|uniref:Reverse transcriptase zinc-binding domain-containing protein n=1 Tax=Gossypium stocksii TaxID=47602 RepID=A0A9D3ZY31_9ROSI|nr:hypothetical protein J1N35_025844 [Gossypium stocksii]